MLNRFPITVGFELEFELPPSVRIESVAQAMSSAGYRVNNVGGWRRTPSEVSTGGLWDVKTDSSCGYEAVTPVITTLEQLRSCAAAARVIRRAGGQATSRCGLHVHFGLRDMPAAVLERIFNFFVRYESAFFLLVPASRRTNQYCKPLSETHTDGIRRIIRTSRQLSGDCRDLAGAFRSTWEDKNVWMNGRTFHRIGTLEFRLLEGTLDPEQIEGFVLFMMQIFNELIAGKSVSWGKASAKTERMLFFTMLQQANLYVRKNRMPADPELAILARKWAIKTFKDPGWHHRRVERRRRVRPAPAPAPVTPPPPIVDDWIADPQPAVTSI